MRRNSKNKKAITVTALLVVGMLLILLFTTKHWLKQTYYRMKAEHTVTSQIQPLEEVLTSLGFKNLKRLDTKCGNITYRPDPVADQLRSGGDYFECSSGLDRYVKVPADTAGKARFNQSATKLSQILQANGWKSRPDYPTIPWFQKISDGVDYQPDQLNTKEVSGFRCTVDFFTAYSKLYNEKPAISLRVFCDKPSGPQPKSNIGIVKE